MKVGNVSGKATSKWAIPRTRANNDIVRSIQNTLIWNNPQQNEFNFGKLQISSNFDSGNLADAKEINN